MSDSPVERNKWLAGAVCLALLPVLVGIACWSHGERVEYYQVEERTPFGGLYVVEKSKDRADARYPTGVLFGVQAGATVGAVLAGLGLGFLLIREAT